MNEIPHAFQCLRGVGDGGGGAGGLRGGVGGVLVFSCKPPSLSLLFFLSLLLSFVGLFFFYRRRRGEGEEGRGGFIASQIEEIYCFDPCAPLSG